MTVVYGMDNAEYHALPDVGSSGLKTFRRSPLHYWSAYRDPARERREPTPLMRIGTAWHAAIFEPGKLEAEYVEIPEGLDRRTKEGKALWAEIEASGREPLSASGMAQIRAMAQASRAHPVVRVIMDQPDGVGEASMFWTDAESGVRCKIRPDYHVPPCAMFPDGLILDGKSIDDASPDAFARNAWNAEHYIQAGLYCEGAQQVWRTNRPPVFAWLVQERDAPHAVAVYSAADDLIEFGRRQIRPLLRNLAECERSGQWPGYPQTVQPLALPVWAEKQIAETV